MTETERYERILADLFDPKKNSKLLKITDICKILKTTRNTLDRMRKGVYCIKGTKPFPPPDFDFNPGGKPCPRWSPLTLNDWINSCIIKKPVVKEEVNKINSGINLLY
jgi:hypothetical protein